MAPSLLVLSISYADNEDTVLAAYAQKVCAGFAKLAACGVTLCVASGDGGAAGTGDTSECLAADGRSHTFLPAFPALCPYVTSVGSVGPDAPLQPSDFSGGGFSHVFGVPDWQKAATKQYQKLLGTKHKGFYNASKRGIPDVALLGDDYLIVAGVYESAHSGTSASTPVFAAMIALLNDIRLHAGKPVLGHLNPVLYSTHLTRAFTDVVDGSSDGCSWGNTFEIGFEALKGWDAATGLGTPDFAKLRALRT